MKGIGRLLKQLKAVFTPSLSRGMKKIYSDFFNMHEENQVLMLHRKDLYTPGPPHQHFSPMMLEMVEKHAGHKILDIGCGHGVNCIELNNRGFHCIGIEAKEEYACEARKHVEAYHMRAEKLEFPDKSFDTVIMLEVLEHLADPYAALSEIVRVARKNLILSVPNLSPLEVCVEYNVIMHHFFEPTHVNFFTKSMLERFLKKYFPYVEVGEFGQFFNISGKKLYYHLSAAASFDPIGRR
ncbi:MAG: methyltransferase domain-containing protein [Candidatus Aminicenantes bacterium]|nr:methyltransferase domain-containing protein [Candidatus Aminicenantes bacterium]NIM83392.1 methyltransferase domain-containing protein [Candidatus Aminicenantes bacterium]NIN22784.1 methyltransferase domain-containing protein [Candidatus Aminicenantes bacterium]NIN46518.1 methyltransferase domain-containing protein [Candidatus Aminicenantes bacterium]NIN89423.1 methyltransferase domain-containing protein [Candidatus Aminicenantes bacterium]